jgi:hypothetical protein
MAILRLPALPTGRSTAVPPLDAPLRPLCPSCHATTVNVTVHATVTFDVVSSCGEGVPGELQVIAHEWLDTGWEVDAPVRCLRCDWQGRVDELTAS